MTFINFLGDFRYASNVSSSQTTPLFLILIYWLFLLAKDRPSKEKSLHEVAAWGGALSAFCAVTIGGLFNTTLHHEHGSLAILLLGIWLASRNYTKTTK